MKAIATGAQGPTTPGFRVRFLLPAAEIARHGVDLQPLPLFSQAEADALSSGTAASRIGPVLRARRRYRQRLAALDDVQIAMVQRQVDVLPSLGLEKLVAAPGRRVILDVDDAIWLDGSRASGGGRLLAVKRSAHKLRWLASRADHVVAGNAYLADWLAPYAHEISVIPSLVDPATMSQRKHADSGELVIGWIGSRTTARYLERIAPALSSLARSRTDLDFTLLVVGGPAPPGTGMRIDEVGWSEETEAMALGRMDIGLMPLPDDLWTRGKCAYKALQYMGAGIPVVGDDVGVTAEVVGDGGGFVVQHAREWAPALEALVDDAAVRQRMGDAGRQRVEHSFSVQAWGPRLATIIRGTDR